MVKMFMVLLIGIEANYFEIEIGTFPSMEACLDQAEMEEDVNYYYNRDFIWRCE